MDDVRQSCTGCTPEQIQAHIDAKQPDILRDLIDQSLLVQRAKDMDINVESDVVKRLDEIRQENNIASMEELESKIEAAGWITRTTRTTSGPSSSRRKPFAAKLARASSSLTKMFRNITTDHPDEFTRPEQVVSAGDFHQHR